MRVYLLYLMVFVLMAQASHAQNAHFFDELYDVPVMNGLVIVPDQAISYDKPEGRISQAIAYAPNNDWSAIQSFYKETLMQMGWQSLGNDKYSRERELLEINHEKTENSDVSGLIIRFLLRPQS